MTPATVAALRAAVGAPKGADSDRVRAHLDDLTKPRGSLGRLEELAVQIGVVLGDPPPVLEPRTVFVLAGDHGVTVRGVSAYPSVVTSQMCANIAAGTAAVSVLARAVRAKVVVADLGVAEPVCNRGVVDANVVRGTRDLSCMAALSHEELEAALLVGAELARTRAADARLVAVGEMGIGSTTAASALSVLLTGCTVAEAVGRGTGISDAALVRKRRAIERGVERVGAGANVERILAEVGGAEIGGMCGVILEAAAAHRIVILDGFIASVAGLAALRMAPGVRPFLVASHRSAEPGHRMVLEALGLDPLLDLRLRLGEASGAVLAIPLLDAAAALLRDMATFSAAGVSRVSDRGLG